MEMITNETFEILYLAHTPMPKVMHLKCCSRNWCAANSVRNSNACRAIARLVGLLGPICSEAKPISASPPVHVDACIFGTHSSKSAIISVHTAYRAQLLWPMNWLVIWSTTTLVERRLKNTSNWLVNKNRMQHKGKKWLGEFTSSESQAIKLLNFIKRGMHSKTHSKFTHSMNGIPEKRSQEIFAKPHILHQKRAKQ